MKDMSELAGMTPLEVAHYDRPHKEDELTFADLSEVERAVTVLYVTNAALLSHFAAEDEITPPYDRRAVRAAMLTMLAATVVLAGCSAAREQVPSYESTAAPAATMRPESTPAPTLVPTNQPLENTVAPPSNATPANTARSESPSAAPTRVLSESTPSPVPEKEVPIWAQGFAFGEIYYATENGEIGPETTMSFTTPDGVSIDITSRPRSLADIRNLEGNQVDPYDFRRSDNAVLQNWDRGTNMVVPMQTVHSANSGNTPLSGEEIRAWLEVESSSVFGVTQRTADEMAERADSLEGATVEISQNGKVEKGEIVHMLRADTNALEAHMRVLHPDQQKYPNQFQTYDYLDYFKKSDIWTQYPDDDFVMYMFCGRDAEGEVNNGRNRLETHRWIMVVRRVQ